MFTSHSWGRGCSHVSSAWCDEATAQFQRFVYYVWSWTQRSISESSKALPDSDHQSLHSTGKNPGSLHFRDAIDSGKSGFNDESRTQILGHRVMSLALTGYVTLDEPLGPFQSQFLTVHENYTNISCWNWDNNKCSLASVYLPCT